MRGTTINGERRSLERHVVINGTHIRIKSVFTDDVPLEKAPANIARRRLVIISFSVGTACSIYYLPPTAAVHLEN